KGARNTQCIPYFKRAHFPTETSFQSIVNLIKFICNFRDTMTGIGKQAIKGVPIKIAGLTFVRQQDWKTISKLLDSLCGLQYRKMSLHGWLILQCLQIQGMNLTLATSSLHFLKKTLFCFTT